jgi:hypothetical protein
MSRHFVAYLAIVGTLVLARAGAVNAGGPVNIPHINIPPPHINSTPPHLSIRTPPPSIRQTTVSNVGKWSVPAAQSFSSATRAGSVQAGVMTQTGGRTRDTTTNRGSHTTRLRLRDAGGVNERRCLYINERRCLYINERRCLYINELFRRLLDHRNSERRSVLPLRIETRLELPLTT